MLYCSNNITYPVLIGKLWDDKDFDNLKLDKYCKGEIAPRVESVRTFRNWYEDWEKTQFKNGGNDYFGQCVVTIKYGGICFKDKDPPYKVGYVPEFGSAVLQRCYKSRNRKTEMEPVEGYSWFYGLLVVYDGFDHEKSYRDQDQALYDIFELCNSDFYEMVGEYYQENNNPSLNIREHGDEDEWVPNDEIEQRIRKHGIWMCADAEEIYPCQVAREHLFHSIAPPIIYGEQNQARCLSSTSRWRVWAIAHRFRGLRCRAILF